MDSVQLLPQPLTQALRDLRSKTQCSMLSKEVFPTCFSACSFFDLPSEKPNTSCWLLLRQPLWFLPLASPAWSWMFLAPLQKPSTIYRFIMTGQNSFWFSSMYWAATSDCFNSCFWAGKISLHLYLALAERQEDRQELVSMVGIPW